jgi:hypothetical protein
MSKLYKVLYIPEADYLSLNNVYNLTESAKPLQFNSKEHAEIFVKMLLHINSGLNIPKIKRSKFFSTTEPFRRELFEIMEDK